MATNVKTFGDAHWEKGQSPLIDAELEAEFAFDPEARNVGERLYAADPKIKNILITGGAGFMCVRRAACPLGARGAFV